MMSSLRSFGRITSTHNCTSHVHTCTCTCTWLSCSNHHLNIKLRPDAFVEVMCFILENDELGLCHVTVLVHSSGTHGDACMHRVKHHPKCTLYIYMCSPMPNPPTQRVCYLCRVSYKSTCTSIRVCCAYVHIQCTWII